jgi:hypothetical protein
MNEMWIESVGGMILIEENQSTCRKVCPIATLSTTNPIQTGLGSNPGHLIWIAVKNVTVFDLLSGDFLTVLIVLHL